jgi:hypothetical protein
MKNFSNARFARLFGIIVMVAVIGFSMAACDDGGGGGGGGDTTAPSLSAGSVNRTSHIAATISFTTDEAGTAFYLVQNSGAAAPTSTAVKAGASLGAVTSGANTNKSVTLTAGAKDIYVVVEDSSGNISAPLKIEVTAFNPGNTPVGSTLAEKLQWIKDNAQSNTSYTIEVTADEEIAPQDLEYSESGGYPALSNITITLNGGTAERTISLSSNGNLFIVRSGVTLVLGNNITLQGKSDNNRSLVSVSSGGALEMKTGAKITGNTHGYNQGGGVDVSSGGTFTMDGGKISGNTVSQQSAAGGGVLSYGTFTMNDGEISGNTCTGADNLSRGSRGGGVYVPSGTFTMNSGKISGNTVSAAGGNLNQSQFANGGGVCVGNATFTMNGGEISGNSATASGSYASSRGGGVTVSSATGTFRIVTGTIYGSNETDESLRNTANSGQVLFSVYNATAQHGTFNGETWNGTDIPLYSLSNYDNTLKVVNGVLQ